MKKIYAAILIFTLILSLGTIPANAGGSCAKKCNYEQDCSTQCKVACECKYHKSVGCPQKGSAECQVKHAKGECKKDK